MDSTAPDAAEVSAAPSEDGVELPHEALSVMLPLLPLDARARAACVCRAWRAMLAHPRLREELSFERCTARVDNATLASLCARAGSALRTLCLDAHACTRVTGSGLVAALSDGHCSGLRRLNAPIDRQPWQQTLTAVLVRRLVAACPKLQHAACAVSCSLADAAAVSAAVPGALDLSCAGENAAGFKKLVARLRVDATLTTLKLSCTAIGSDGATQLAESLRSNGTLTALDLAFNRIGDPGAVQLAECLRVNTALKSLNLHQNGIGDAGAAQLGRCLDNNATLTSLDLSQNHIGDAAAVQLAASLRANTTLTRLSLQMNQVGDAGATQLAEALRANATLTSLDLSQNGIGDAGAMRLAESLCVSGALKELGMWGNRNIGEAGVRAVLAAYQLRGI